MGKHSTNKDVETKFYYHKELQPFTNSRLKYLREQVERLKKMPQPEQRTEAWYSMREDRITASDFATALDQSPYQKQSKLLWKKVTKDRTFNINSAILWGVKYEEVAVQIYEYRNSVNVVEYGCIKHPHLDWLGASPDGITDDGVMLEIKCPSSRPITGVIPSYYWCQVQGQLEVCELDRCDFLECKLVEYKNREEFERDNYNGNYFYNNLGMEKGVVVVYFKLQSKSYKFSYVPLGLRGKELDEWINQDKMKNVNSECIFSNIDYWRLEKVSCIPIYRNQEWFYSVIPKFREFWEMVLYYRSKDISELNKYLEDEKLKNKKKKIKKKTQIKKKEKKINFFDTPISDFLNFKDSSNNIFIGIEDEVKNNKEPKDLLSGNFVIIDGKKVEIDSENLFSNSTDQNESQEIMIDNHSLKSNKCLFSSKNFSINNKKKDEEELFYNKNIVKKEKKGNSYFNLKFKIPEVNYDESELFSNSSS